MEGVTRLRLPTNPLPPPHRLRHAIPYITIAVKKVAENRAVLAC